MSLSFPNSEDRHKLWGGPPGPGCPRGRAPWPACRRLQAPESPRKERDEGVLAQRAPRPGGPPHHLCRTQLRENYATLGFSPPSRERFKTCARRTKVRGPLWGRLKPAPPKINRRTRARLALLSDEQSLISY